MDKKKSDKAKDRIVKGLLDEISLVKKGANRWKFLLTKSDEGIEKMDKEKLSALLSMVEKADILDEDMEKLISKADISDEAKGAILSAIKMLKAYEKEIPAAVIKGLSDMLGADEEKKEEVSEKKKEEAPEIKKEYKLGSVIKADGTLDTDNVPKEMISAVTELYELQKAQAKKQADFEALVTAQKMELKKAEVLSKAAKLDSIPDNKELGNALFNIEHGTDAEKASGIAVIMKSLDAANEIVKQGAIFKEVGSSLEQNNNSAWGEICKKAEALIEKSTEALAGPEARQLVMDKEPELYIKYLTEQKELSK